MYTTLNTNCRQYGKMYAVIWKKPRIPKKDTMTKSRPWEGVCSREVDSPTTSGTESGTEYRSADACKHEKKDIRNPVIRIPEHIPERSREEEPIAEAGNPDIRVPERFKSEDGLPVRRALETGDAEDEDEQGDTENGDKTREQDGGRAPVEVQTGTGLGDATVGQEGPKERECRHVPGGTWLSQLVRRQMFLVAILECLISKEDMEKSKRPLLIDKVWTVIYLATEFMKADQRTRVFSRHIKVFISVNKKMAPRTD
ncbi:hypothetical protein NDU88_005191 [Pleurodeles waltl]|uniref:Uncharacterized protein n=1 Tax=Pleurodeles waltl TaxID=8319 RepID=A0AAV7QFA5_PLEWA|nr:hypothetical protein NDU88_005191 [Pleurodeles waltl]